MFPKCLSFADTLEHFFFWPCCAPVNMDSLASDINFVFKRPVHEYKRFKVTCRYLTSGAKYR